MSNSNIKILVVEDEPVIMQDITDYLESLGYDVLGKAYSASKAIDILDKRLADLVLLDINLNDKMDGVEIANRINEEFRVPFIFLTSYADQATIARVRSTMPAGYIVKPFDEKDLFAAIEIALFNFQTREEKAELSKAYLGSKFENLLTSKEIDVLFDIFLGKTNREIAESHNISLNTVKTHVKKVYDKLHVSSRSDVLVKLRNL